MKKAMFAGVASCLISTSAFAINAPCPAVSNSQLATALHQAVVDTAGKLGLGLNMWATVVAADGRVCAVANSSGNAITGQWLASRLISAQKAFTAATLSLGSTPNSGSGTGLATGKLALSTANLYSAVQPGGSLYGLQHSNPVWSADAYGDKINTSNGTFVGPDDTGTYGTATDPMIGSVVGGINVFGGGLALYSAPTTKVGGVGVSGDTSCTDHLIAWRTRHNLNLDHLAGVNGVSGDTSRPDNIVFDLVYDPNPNAPSPSVNNVGPYSTGGWGHPTCLGNSNSTSTAAATGLPAVQP
jgi:uncharacterized protein GlcG (DUF336 family)